MKFSKTLVALGIAALAATAMAADGPPGPNGPQNGPQFNRDHRDNDRWDRDHRSGDRDFRFDRDHRQWNDRDHRRNFETHRDHVRELRIGMRKREVLELPWWRNPLFVQDRGPFDEYVYADGRFGRCVLEFKFNRLAEIQCN